jgi:energy-coupling factor transporter ATP-binding protein EcfA2
MAVLVLASFSHFLFLLLLLGLLLCYCFAVTFLGVHSAIEISDDLDPFGLRLAIYGPEQAGKSTLFKQMQCFYLHRKTIQNQPATRWQIHTCCLESMQHILDYLLEQELLEELLPTEPYRAMARRIQKIDTIATNPLRRSVAQDISQLWKLPKLRDVAFRRRITIGLTNDAFFFLGEALRISLPGYLPTVEDALRVHVPTTTVTLHTFPLYKGLEYHLIQLGGSPSQRRKFYECCYDLDMLCFVVDSSTYVPPPLFIFNSFFFLLSSFFFPSFWFVFLALLRLFFLPSVLLLLHLVLLGLLLLLLFFF